MADLTGIASGGVYTWAGFCAAAQAIKKASGLSLYGGTGSGSARTAQVLSNIASFLSQTKVETGYFKNCDEANWRGYSTASCTQRADGQRYDSLTGPPACTVDLNMHMVAVTKAHWGGSPPMECVPGTATAGCCWWGRGSIQTTGPHNYKMLQLHVVDNITHLKGKIDLCTNPEAICENEELKWLGGLYYWTSVVQKAKYFEQSLQQYVDSGFNKYASVIGGASFNDGTGGMINNGLWSSRAHANYKRNQYFQELIDGLKAAGMSHNMPASQVTTARIAITSAPAPAATQQPTSKAPSSQKQPTSAASAAKTSMAPTTTVKIADIATTSLASGCTVAALPLCGCDLTGGTWCNRKNDCYDYYENWMTKCGGTRRLMPGSGTGMILI
jgi:predicted chitinase